MNRLAFLQRFLGTGLLITAPRLAQAALAPVLHKEILLYEGFVAGFTYYEGKKLLSQMKEGDSLDLLREPDNQYDNKAIAIYWEGQKLGFMPQIDNSVLAAILDAALPCSAYIATIFSEREDWEKLVFEIHLNYPIT
jgi:HIRAN domain